MAIEETWETFWTTGSVADYLTYRNAAENTQEQRKRQEYGTVGDRDGYGVDRNACQ